MSPTAGYSGTPLPQKLGIKAGDTVGLDGPPSGFEKTLGALPEGARLVPAGRGRAFDVLLPFARDRKSLEAKLEKNVARMAEGTALWICWPKKTSPLASDVNENDVRALGLAAGVVDVKVCAVDEDWSGLKFVYRLKDRLNWGQSPNPSPSGGPRTRPPSRRGGGSARLRFPAGGPSGLPWTCRA